MVAYRQYKRLLFVIVDKIEATIIATRNLDLLNKMINIFYLLQHS